MHIVNLKYKGEIRFIVSFDLFIIFSVSFVWERLLHVSSIWTINKAQCRSHLTRERHKSSDLDLG